MKVIIYNGTQAFDATEFTGDKTWGGEVNAAPRTLEFTLFTKGLPFTVELGQMVLLTNNGGKVLFKGLLFNITKDKTGNWGVKAYDSLFYFTNNTDIFAFKNVSIDTVVKEIAKRFGIKLGKIETSSFKIKSLPLQEMTLYDYFKKANKITFDSTGQQFYLRDNNGAVELLKRRNQVHQWLIEAGNLIEYNYAESSENLKSKVKLVNTEDEKTIIATAQDNALIKKFGILQHYENVSDKVNQAQLNQRAKQVMKEKGRIDKTFSLTCLNIDDVMAGDSVYINIPELKIKRAYYVQKDTHSYSGNVATMSLELKESLEVEG